MFSEGLFQMSHSSIRWMCISNRLLCVKVVLVVHWDGFLSSFSGVYNDVRTCPLFVFDILKMKMLKNVVPSAQMQVTRRVLEVVFKNACRWQEGFHFTFWNSTCFVYIENHVLIQNQFLDDEMQNSIHWESFWNHDEFSLERGSLFRNLAFAHRLCRVLLNFSTKDVLFEFFFFSKFNQSWKIHNFMECAGWSNDKEYYINSGFDDLGPPQQKIPWYPVISHVLEQNFSPFFPGCRMHSNLWAMVLCSLSFRIKL